MAGRRHMPAEDGGCVQYLAADAGEGGELDRGPQLWAFSGTGTAPTKNGALFLKRTFVEGSADMSLLYLLC